MFTDAFPLLYLSQWLSASSGSGGRHHVPQAGGDRLPAAAVLAGTILKKKKDIHVGK